MENRFLKFSGGSWKIEILDFFRSFTKAKISPFVLSIFVLLFPHSYYTSIYLIVGNSFTV